MSEHETITYKPRYETARGFCTVIVALGGLALVGGFVLAYMMVFTMADGSYSVKVVALAPPLGLAMAGLVNIVLGQIGYATIDNANANQEMLALMKQGANRE